MKLLKTVIAATLAATITFANSFSVELPLIPIQNTLDINGNHYPDFFAFGASSLNRSLYIYDVTPKGLSEIWSFSLNETQNGYIADAILSDFDGDGNNEILVAIELENQPGKFYLFPSVNKNFSKKPSQKFPYPNGQNKMRLTKMQTIDWNNDGKNEIAMVMGSPNRSAMICYIQKGEFKIMEKIATDFVKNTFGLLLLSSGDFDGDNVDDLIIINNGIEPTSFQYLSNSSPQKVSFSNNGPIIFIAEPTDVNNDNIKDLLFLTGNGQLFSPAWGRPIALDHSNYKHIFAKTNLASNTLIILAFSQHGDIQKIQLSEKNTLISVDAYYPTFFAKKVINPEILYINNNQNALVFHNGDAPEVSTLELEPLVNYAKQQRSDGREANIILKSEQLYEHPIESVDGFSFSEFKTDSLPDGMEFNLDSFALDWTPTLNQLGFHELDYLTAFNISGELIINQDAGTIVTSTSSDTSLTNSYLFYVNDQPFFATNNSVDFLIVNKDTLNASFSIKDRNVDAIINVGVNTSQAATHIYKNPIIPEDEEDQNSEVDSESNEALDDIPSATESAEETEMEENGNEATEANENEVKEENGDEGTETAKIEEPITTEETESTDSIKDYSEIKHRKSQFQWVPNGEPGLYPFMLWVNDLHSSDSLKINVSVHPRIYLNNNQTDFILTVGKPFEYKINVTQKLVTDSSYNFEIRNAPENMYIDSTGSIYWVPVITQVDNHYIIVDVDDGVASESITLTLYVNDPPIASKRPAELLFLEKTALWEYSLTSFDANLASNITWELLDAPHTMTLDSIGNLRWLVNEVDYWDYSVQISDGFDSTIFTNSIYSNYLPRITSIPIESIIWTDEYNYQISCQDDNQYSPSQKDTPNLLTYSFDKSPSTMSISDSGTVMWQPLKTDEGVHQIIINVNDGLVNVKQKYNLLVKGPPAITIADSLAISVGDTLQLQLTHKNFQDTDNLKYKTDPLPKSLQINSSTGMANWTPTIQDIGLFNYTVTIQNETESAEKSLKLFVYQYPELNLNAPTEAYVGLTYIYNLQAFDMFGKHVEKNGGEIRLQSETISEIQFNNETHTIQWDPSEDHLGEHEFTVVALDQFGLATSVTHSVSVFMSPCELCKSTKHETKTVKQVLTPVFKKDTPEKMGENPSPVKTTSADSIQVPPVDSLVAPQDSLLIDTNNNAIENNFPKQIKTTTDSIKVAPIDSLIINQDSLQTGKWFTSSGSFANPDKLDTTILSKDSLSFPPDTLKVELDSITTTMDSLILPILPDSSIIDTVIE